MEPDQPSPTTWNCEVCTFVNKQTDICCAMCYTVLPSSRNQDVTWEWCASVHDGRWIPFDLPAIEFIERQYLSDPRPSVVSLDEVPGYFQDSEFSYRMDFESMHQVNMQTGGRRRVRRLCMTDFGVDVSREQTGGSDEDICSICYDPLFPQPKPSPDTPAEGKNNSEDEDTENAGGGGEPQQQGEGSGGMAVIRLPKCQPGHYFHRGCVLRWCRLRNFCPYCKVPV